MGFVRPLLLIAISILIGALLVEQLSLAKSKPTVSVFYAGSLITQMEGPIRFALDSKGVDFQGQAGGSKQLASLISSGVKTPDVFISVDPKLIAALGPKVARAETFARTSLGLGWSDKSRFRALFGRVASGKTTALSALQTPDLSIGRTDPALDPKGAYTIQAMNLLAGADGEQKIFGSDNNPLQTFPEEDLLSRIDVGLADVGFFYKTEAVARGLYFVPLPGAASMSDKIEYTIAVMKDAPHPDQAKAFEAFIVTGQGKQILQKAGIEYLTRPRAVAPQ